MPKKLYRSRKDQIVAGVCAGVADYFSLDPTLVRIIWALFTVISAGAGFFAYLVGMIIIPVEPRRRLEAAAAAPPAGPSAGPDGEGAPAVGEAAASEVRAPGAGAAEGPPTDAPEPNQANAAQRRTLLGVALVALGAFFMIRNFYPHFPFLETRYVWPSVLILIGFVVLVNGFKGRS